MPWGENYKWWKKFFCELLNRHTHVGVDGLMIALVCTSVFRTISEEKAAWGEGVAAVSGEGLAGWAAPPGTPLARPPHSPHQWAVRVYFMTSLKVLQSQTAAYTIISPNIHIVLCETVATFQHCYFKLLKAWASIRLVVLKGVTSVSGVEQRYSCNF